jgi:glyoxylase-like metal-dependent hydrolase (beta-lactamase superfamily II)
VFLAQFVSGPWSANCYRVGERHGGEAVVIDPGVGAAETVRGLVAEHGLSLVAVLATHGHIDHIASAQVLADGYGVPLWVHSADRAMLTEPALGLDADAARLAAASVPYPLVEPRLLSLYDESGRLESAGAGRSELAGAERLDRAGQSSPVAEQDGRSPQAPDQAGQASWTLELAGLAFKVVEAPGHTPGSVLLRVDYPDDPEVAEVVFSGDVLFAGSIGRTDFPGGDPRVMRATLDGPVLELPGSAAILPGHGPQTLMATERVRNPYLRK